MEIRYFAKQTKDSVKFQTLEQNQLQDWIDLQSVRNQDHDQRLNINHFKVRLFVGNNESQFITYSSIDGWYLCKLLTVIWKDIQKLSEKFDFYKNLHDLTGLVKNDTEETWYLTWK